MDTETEANLAPEVVDIPATEPTAPEAEANEADGAQSTEADDIDQLLGEPEGEPEEVEVEYEGKTYKLSPELKDALLRQSDYTKKTMEVAEQRKAIEARSKHLETFETLSKEKVEAYQNVAKINAQIEQIENLPLDGLTQEQINGFRMDLQDLRGQAAQWDNYLRTVAQREQDERGQQFAKAVETARSEAAKIIPNFESRRTELEAFAIATGASPDDVQNIADPAVWKILHLADIGQRTVEAKRKAKNIAAASQAQPASRIGGKASGSKPPEAMSPAEMAKHLGLPG